MLSVKLRNGGSYATIKARDHNYSSNLMFFYGERIMQGVMDHLLVGISCMDHRPSGDSYS